MCCRVSAGGGGGGRPVQDQGAPRLPAGGQGDGEAGGGAPLCVRQSSTFFFLQRFNTRVNSIIFDLPEFDRIHNVLVFDSAQTTAGLKPGDSQSSRGNYYSPKHGLGWLLSDDHPTDQSEVAPVLGGGI